MKPLTYLSILHFISTMLLPLQLIAGFRIEYTLMTVNSPDCEPSLADDFPVRVQYRTLTYPQLMNKSSDSQSNNRNRSGSEEWMDPPYDQAPMPDTDCVANLTTSAASLPVHVTVRSYSLLFPSDIDHINSSQRVQLRLVQSDHRGGFCDCWAVSDLKLKFVKSNRSIHEVPLDQRCATSGASYTSLADFLGNFLISDDTITCSNITAGTSLVGFCQGSASIPRGFVSVELGAGTESQCDSDAAVVDTGRGAPLMGNQCESKPHVVVRFSLRLGGTSAGNALNSFDEGVEFSFQNLNSSSRAWVPLMFYTSRKFNNRDNRINIGVIDATTAHVNIRGYRVPYVIDSSNAVQAIEANLNICGSEIAQSDGLFNHIQFRWLQTTIQSGHLNRDRALLDNVIVSSYLGGQYKILMDDFDNQVTIADSSWTRVERASLLCDQQEQCQLQFGMVRPTFVPQGSATIISRGISTVPLDPNPPRLISYTLITANSPADCLNTGSFIGLPPLLQYRQGDNKWMNLNPYNKFSWNFVSDKMGKILAMTFVASLNMSNDSVQFRFVQLEHRGGLCDCWAVANLTVTDWVYKNILNDTCDVTGQYINMKVDGDMHDNNIFFLGNSSSHEELQMSIVAELCGGSASVARGFVSHKAYLLDQSTEDLPSCDGNSVVIDSKDNESTECSNSELRIEITFDLDFLTWSSDCNSINSFHEGIELSFRSLTENENRTDREWRPLMYFTSNSNLNDNTNASISVVTTLPDETRGSFMLRGYNVPYVIANRSTHNVTLCRDSSVLLEHPLEFRWLQTSSVIDRSIRDDVILLDNITISLRNGSHNASLFKQSFDDQKSIEEFNVLTMDNIHWMSSMNSTSDCKPLQGGALFFYTQPTAQGSSDTHFPMISSRRLVIGPLDLRNITLKPRPPVIVQDSMPLQPTNEENRAMNEINSNQRLSEIFTSIEKSPDLALQRLATVLEEPSEEPNSTTGGVGLSVATYLLSAIGDVLGNDTVNPVISEAFVSVANNILEAAQRTVRRGTDTPDDVAGSTLLQVLERFALNNHDIESQEPKTKNIVFRVKEVVMDGSTVSLSPISEEETAHIHIPREVLADQETGKPIRMASFLFRNMSGLLPQRVIDNNGTENASDAAEDRVFRLASPVISASFQCDTCKISNLSTPVQVTFTHTPYDVTLLENDRNSSEVKCVFWDFDEVLRTEAVLFQGQWSKEGCHINKELSTLFMTVCECNHLTNFAILLSARPPTFTPSQILALQAFGYIGVSISLVAMVATIFVFLFLKALRTMRNYIHIQLCVTLGIAQIIFVAGIEPRLGEGNLVGGVPVGCRLVAVLLHYWFLVSFMWMLMEGVVLYVALVRVFVKYHARYIAAFTIASYGLPLLYVGGLTVPLGFARSEEMRKYQDYDYGYEQACYLNPARSFIWSFIAPVILILFANIGFFIMAIFIMYRHQKRQHSKEKAKEVRHWLKASISLTVVMGITWIIGVLVVEVKELFALAFIFTIFVAFQGLFIFIFFVLLSKQVREGYAKWWKAKVAESDFLSKHFGEKSFTSTRTTRRSAPSISFTKSTAQESSVAGTERFELSQSEVIKNTYVEEGPTHDKEQEKPPNQDFGTFFNIIFVPNQSTSLNTLTHTDLYHNQGSSSDNLMEMEL